MRVSDSTDFDLITTILVWLGLVCAVGLTASFVCYCMNQDYERQLIEAKHTTPTTVLICQSKSKDNDMKCVPGTVIIQDTLTTFIDHQ